MMEVERLKSRWILELKQNPLGYEGSGEGGIKDGCLL